MERIKQLGPAFLVYRGAVHTRFNHSLGVFYLAKRMITRLISRSILKGVDLSGVKSFLCASLLHDLGHYPYAHSLKDLDVENHESLTAKRIMKSDLSGHIKRDIGVDPKLVAAIIDRTMKYPGGDEIKFYRNLLSGVLDPDKLDYLNRDAYFCGIPYGIQDFEFLLNEIYPHPLNGLAISMKGLTSVESLLFSKYLMYKTVYWHKTVRVATAMVKKAVCMGLCSGIIEKSQLYWLDDQEFFKFFEMSHFPPFQLVNDVLNRNLYKTVFRARFDPNNRMHNQLESITTRLTYEEKIAQRITKLTGKKVADHEIIIDIPEKISFEIELPVLDISGGGYLPFRDTGSVFSESVIEGFSRCLRYISVICRPKDDIIDGFKKLNIARLLQDVKTT